MRIPSCAIRRLAGAALVAGVVLSGAAPAGAAPFVGPQTVLRPPSRLPADFYPGKGFRQGRRIPRGHVVVRRRAVLRDAERARTRLTCPAGYRMRSLATTRGALGFLVLKADRDYFLRLRTVRMTLEVQPRPFAVPGQSPAQARAAARTARGTIAGLCRRRG